MKSTLPALFSLLAIGAGCSIAGCSITVDDDLVDGSGLGRDDDGGEVRSVGNFVNVTNLSDADVVLVRPGDGRDAGDVTVICDNGFGADVDTWVDGDGTLLVDLAADVASVLGCEVHVVTDGLEEVVDEGDGDIVSEEPMPEVRHIEVKGNGSIHLATVEADELYLVVAGNGSLGIDDVAVDMLHVDLGGNGDIGLGGDAQDAHLEIGGNGDFKAKALTVAETLDALLDGAGSGVVTVLGTVNAEVHGNVSLEIYGGAEPGDVVESDGGKVIFY